MDYLKFHCVGSYDAIGDDGKDYLIKVYKKRNITTHMGSEFHSYNLGKVKYLEANGECVNYVSKGCYISDDGVTIKTNDIDAP